jgi:hypothetical protein
MDRRLWVTQELASCLLFDLDDSKASQLHEKWLYGDGRNNPSRSRYRRNGHEQTDLSHRVDRGRAIYRGLSRLEIGRGKADVMISRWVRWFGYLVLVGQVLLGLHDNGLLRSMKEEFRSYSR